MEELLELRQHIEQGHYPEALNLIGELEEMSREDKLNKIGSFIEILLLHLIKQLAEQRTTRSWDISIKNALDNIEDVNKRRKAGGYYLSPSELAETIEAHYIRALRRASLEAFEGIFEEATLEQKFAPAEVKAMALRLIMKQSL